MIVKRAESAVRPAEWDLESSEIYVYHNTDIIVKEATEESPEMYEYTSAKMTLKEYSLLMQDAQSQNIKDINDALIELAEIIGG